MSAIADKATTASKPTIILWLPLEARASGSVVAWPGRSPPAGGQSDQEAQRRAANRPGERPRETGMPSMAHLADERRAKLGIAAPFRWLSTGHQVQVISERVSSCGFCGWPSRASSAARQMPDSLVMRLLSEVA